MQLVILLRYCLARTSGTNIGVACCKFAKACVRDIEAFGPGSIIPRIATCFSLANVWFQQNNLTRRPSIIAKRLNIHTLFLGLICTRL